ncbi:MAG: bifunctional UDP-N-acetylglucosamine diphosphorylase/glucosamine-1-phosphate N-acetyltransferase GlmU [Nitrospirota bacterium]
MKDLYCVILAAGLGTRMKSSLAKVLHPVAGRPMLMYTLDNVLALKPVKTAVVVGHQADRVKALLPPGVVPAFQKEQKGTAHAASVGLGRLGAASGTKGGAKGGASEGAGNTLLLVSGDTPLLGHETLKGLISYHKRKKADITVLTAFLDDPSGYGRIVREGGIIKKIVEQKDATPSERDICEINSGTYCFDIASLKKALSLVRSENAQGEFYLTDVIEIVQKNGGKVAGLPVDDPMVAMGVNSRTDLAVAEKEIRKKINRRLMGSGVTMTDPESTYISADVKIGPDTIIHPGNHITGNTSIGSGCVLMPGNIISGSVIGGGVKVKGYSVIEDSRISERAEVGPFAHLRPGSVVGAEARVGNFVELKKAEIGEGTKASHLSYLGDAVIGRNVNIGAGTITCNYDGFSKFKTVIGDDVFVGSDTQFIAPVNIGNGALIAAGSTITKDVPDNALALSRAPQMNRENWAKENRSRKFKQKK